MTDAPSFSKWPEYAAAAISIWLIGVGIDQEEQKTLLIVVGLFGLLFSLTYLTTRTVLLADLKENAWLIDKSLAGLKQLGGLNDGYRKALRFGLNKLDKFLGDDVTTRGNSDYAHLNGLVRKGSHPFSLGSYDFCLKLALAYPIIFWFFTWALFGESGFGVGFLDEWNFLAATLGISIFLIVAFIFLFVNHKRSLGRILHIILPLYLFFLLFLVFIFDYLDLDFFIAIILSYCVAIVFGFALVGSGVITAALSIFLSFLAAYLFWINLIK